MSKNTKTCVRLYTIADYEEEEIWLRKMAMKGWMLKKIFVSLYTFERCEPQDMVFKLEFRETPLSKDQEYINMLSDFGWQYVASCNNFRYFCKSAQEDERNNELFTDDESRLKMLRKIELRRMLPLVVVFLCCVVPSSVRMFTDNDTSTGFNVFWAVMLVLYIFIFIRVGVGFLRLEKKYSSR